ncbi:hypothetical protein BJX65DRAFT_296846 [Aspergillus insuetus]
MVAPAPSNSRKATTTHRLSNPAPRAKRVPERHMTRDLYRQYEAKPPREINGWKWMAVVVHPELTWINVGLVMSVAATSLLRGKVFFHFNTKWTYIISVLLFEVGSMNTLIVGRVLCGIGGSGLYIRMVLGPIIGCGLAQSSIGWRWAFYDNLPVGAACAPGAEFMDRAREIDIVGGTLNIGAFVSGTMAISARIIALFICSGVLLALLAIQLVPVEFSKSRTMLILFVATSAARTATFVSIYMIPLFFQFTRGEDAFETGVRLLPLIVLCILPSSAITGLGGGMYLQTGFSIAQASVARTRVADASSFITCSQVVGSTIALAITNSAFLNEAQDNVVRLLPDIGTREVQTVISGASELIKGLTEDLKREVEEGIVTGALTLVVSLLMKRERLFKK